MNRKEVKSKKVEIQKKLMTGILFFDFLLRSIFHKNKKMNTFNRASHEIDYKIHGEEMQCVEIELDPNETAVAESGAFMMMDDGIQMETIFGDGSGQQKGLLGKLMSAGKRVLVGESLFMTAFTNVGQG